MPRTTRRNLSAHVQRIIDSKERARKYAWGKYFGECDDHHRTLIRLYGYAMGMMTNVQNNDNNTGEEAIANIPQHLTNEIEEMVKSLKKALECPICLENIPEGQLVYTGCGHKHCKKCLEYLKTQISPHCSICRKKIK